MKSKKKNITIGITAICLLMTVLITFATHSKDPGTDVYKGQMIWITGMCGGCRIEYDGKPMFVCVDGPEFNGHKVNFDLMIKRLEAYKEQEKRAYEDYQKSKCEICINQ